MSRILCVSLLTVLAGMLVAGCNNKDRDADRDARTSGYEMARETEGSDTPTAKRRGTMVDRSEGTSGGGNQIDGIGTGAPTDTVPKPD